MNVYSSLTVRLRNYTAVYVVRLICSLVWGHGIWRKWAKCANIFATKYSGKIGESFFHLI